MQSWDIIFSRGGTDCSKILLRQYHRLPVLIIETVDLQSFLNSLTTGKGLFGEAAKIKELESFNIKLRFLADQLNKQGYKELMEGVTSLIAFYPSEGRKAQALFCCQPFCWYQAPASKGNTTFLGDR